MKKRIEARLKKLEDKLVPKEQPVLQIIDFGGGELPPDRMCGSTRLTFVHYRDVIGEIPEWERSADGSAPSRNNCK